MSLIIASSDGNTVHMGADSFASHGEDLFFTLEPAAKLMKAGKGLLGSVGSWRLSQLASAALRDFYQSDEYDDGTKSEHKAPTIEELIEWIADAFEGEPSEYDREEYDGAQWDWSGIYALDGEIYIIEGDLAYSRMHGSTPRQIAIGAAGDFAMGALAAVTWHNLSPDPEKQIREAFRLTQRVSTKIAAPYHVLKVTG